MLVQVDDPLFEAMERTRAHFRFRTKLAKRLESGNWIVPFGRNEAARLNLSTQPGQSHARTIERAIKLYDGYTPEELNVN